MITTKLQLYGQVQGVGMRFHIHRTAAQYNVKGYVKNMSDGTVECVLQGNEQVVKAMIHHLEQKHPGSIDRIRRFSVDDSKEFKKFSIKLF